MSVSLTYSKKQVQRAGSTLRDLQASGARRVADEALVEAVWAVDWWRARHARPLARVNPNLRYYVLKANPNATVNVTQRLKRFATLDGYRAVHVTILKDGCYGEIQLRTPWQDVWAQSVEQDTRRLGAGLKFGAGPDDLREYFWAIAEYLENREQHRDPPQELMSELSTLFAATRHYYPEAEST